MNHKYSEYLTRREDKKIRCLRRHLCADLKKKFKTWEELNETKISNESCI